MYLYLLQLLRDLISSNHRPGPQFFHWKPMFDLDRPV